MNDRIDTITDEIKGDILVVDDTPDNLRLLSSMLTDQGYKVRKAINGQLALMAAQSVPPDLILLDINMPDMDGYEVCERLKKDAQTLDIPVIFISALDDVLDKVKAFNVGGVDYVTKPFQLQEVLARMDNQLTVRRLQKHLLDQGFHLKQLLRDRIRAQESLRQAEEKYRSIFENTTEGIFQTNSEGEYISANQALADIYGYSTTADLIDDFNTAAKPKPYVSNTLRQEFQSTLEDLGAVKGFESQIYRRDGSTAWIRESVNAVRNSEGDLMFHVGTVEDITRRKASEVANSTRQNMDQLQMIAQAIPLSVLISRRDDNEIIYANAIATHTFGIPDLIGKNIESIYHDPIAYEKLVAAVGQDQSVRNHEITCQGKNTFRALISLQPFTFDGKEALISIFFDVSES
jgi:adenylate cyclase